MNKTLQRPLACRNAHCGAMCSSVDAEFCGCNPSKCFNYERRDDLYKNNELLDKIRAEIIQSIQNGVIKIESGSAELFRIIDKYRDRK